MLIFDDMTAEMLKLEIRKLNKYKFPVIWSNKNWDKILDENNVEGYGNNLRLL